MIHKVTDVPSEESGSDTQKAASEGGNVETNEGLIPCSGGTGSLTEEGLEASGVALAHRSALLDEHSRADELASRPEIQVLCKYLFPDDEADLGAFGRAVRRETAAEIVLREVIEALRR